MKKIIILFLLFLFLVFTTSDTDAVLAKRKPPTPPPCGSKQTTTTEGTGKQCWGKRCAGSKTTTYHHKKTGDYCCSTHDKPMYCKGTATPCTYKSIRKWVNWPKPRNDCMKYGCDTKDSTVPGQYTNYACTPRE